MKRAYRLSELGKLNNKEALTLLFTFLYGLLITLLILNSIFSPLFLLPILLTNICLVVSRNKKKKREYPVGYIPLLYLMLLSISALLLVFLLNNQIIITWVLIMTILLYINILVIFVYYVMNVVYFWGLKKMFPYEKINEVEQREQINPISRKKLSKYIALDKQIIYYNIILINIIVWFLFNFYWLVFFTKYPEGDHVKTLGIFSDWAKRQDWVNFSNSISIVSLLLAIYSITFPLQKKIIKEAKEIYREKYKEYI
ncbi:hypothetical protein CUC15_04300 [Oceanobacillus zhaokaii]|uniref:Uncharacterized protein n=1 Tax=Oceanobacillus zhaokaii TaxID=2052660 RepID=A0A345PE02_9BACI|nr:hypothetical protein [Oceanobacillus zhaokaii]AXI08232.1 hypothetical protein CUC15_04300 [Oceanobacillus zhaokaii]